MTQEDNFHTYAHTKSDPQILVHCEARLPTLEYFYTGIKYFKDTYIMHVQIFNIPIN